MSAACGREGTIQLVTNANFVKLVDGSYQARSYRVERGHRYGSASCADGHYARRRRRDSYATDSARDRSGRHRLYDAVLPVQRWRFGSHSA
jgi:hypothetical protein